MMEQDNDAKDEIASGMANAGIEQSGKPDIATQRAERQPIDLQSKIAEAGANAWPKIPSANSAPKPAD